MLMGLPPLGSPPEWGMSVSQAVREELVDPLECAGRYISVTLNKASYTGIIISVTETEVFVYINEPREDIVIRPSSSCMFVTHMGNKSADFDQMEHIKKFAQEKGIIPKSSRF